jgi:hypothetical protein
MAKLKIGKTNVHELPFSKWPDRKQQALVKVVDLMVRYRITPQNIFDEICRAIALHQKASQKK